MNKSFRIIAAALMLFCLGIVKAGAGEITPELQSVLSQPGVGNTNVSVIIYFSSNIDLRSYHDRLMGLTGGISVKRNEVLRNERRQVRSEYIRSLHGQAESRQKVVKQFLGLAGAGSIRSLWMVNALAASIPARLVTLLAKLPFVDRVGLDKIIAIQGLPTANGAVPGWNLEMIKATQLWNMGITGQGVVVGSLDTGVDGQHPDLAAQWRGGTNSWYNPYIADSTTQTPYDNEGHGTQTMGVMVGGNSSGEVIGVAPDAQWIAAKIFQDDMTATLSAIHDAFQWMLDPDGNPDTDDAPDVVNSSWGLLTSIGVCNTEFDADIDALKMADIAVVFSAGNEGPGSNTGTSPATNAQVLSAGSVDQLAEVASTSSRGPYPTGCGNGGVFPALSAPGVGINTTDLSFGLGSLLDPYSVVSGTSLAAPHVSGVIALLKSEMPTASVQDMENALTGSAQDLGLPGPDNTYGNGLLDAYSALLSLRCPQGSVDTDNDGYYDACDNCIMEYNPEQTDSDGDGFGNRCDIDMNNDGITNVLDIGLYKAAYTAASEGADVNGDGYTNIIDIGFARALLFKAPGPSGLVP